MPDTVVGTLYIVIPLILTTILWDRYYHYHLHFMDEETGREMSNDLRKFRQPEPGLASEPGTRLCSKPRQYSPTWGSWIPQKYLLYKEWVWCTLWYNPFFAFFLRPAVVKNRKRACLEPWVIGLITFISLIVLAVCIGLTVHYVRYSKYGLPWHHVTYPQIFPHVHSGFDLRQAYSFTIATHLHSWYKEFFTCLVSLT